MEKYIIANKDKTRFLGWESSGFSNFLDMQTKNICEAYMLDDVEQARDTLYEWLNNRGGEKDINKYQIVKVEINISEKYSPIDYSKPFKFSYTTDEYKIENITKERVSSMLDFLFGIKETNFTYTAKLCDLRRRTHTAKVSVNFNKEEEKNEIH